MNSYRKGKVYEDTSGLGKRQPGSGNGWTAKEDKLGEGQFKDYLFQLKNVSGQKSHSIKVEDLINLRRNASKVDRTGAYVINFGEKEEFVVLRRLDFEYLLSEGNDEKSL